MQIDWQNRDLLVSRTIPDFEALQRRDLEGRTEKRKKPKFEGSYSQKVQRRRGPFVFF